MLGCEVIADCCEWEELDDVLDEMEVDETRLGVLLTPNELGPCDIDLPVAMVCERRFG